MAQQIIVTCAICGKDFPAKSYCKKYCSDACATEGKNERVRVFRKKEKESRHVNTTSALVDIAGKAHAAGMTYGQYVAMINMQSGALLGRKNGD